MIIDAAALKGARPMNDKLKTVQDDLAFLRGRGQSRKARAERQRQKCAAGGKPAAKVSAKVSNCQIAGKRTQVAAAAWHDASPP